MGIKQVKLEFTYKSNKSRNFPAECEKIPIENLELDSPESIFVMILATFGKSCFTVQIVSLYWISGYLLLIVLFGSSRLIGSLSIDLSIDLLLITHVTTP